MLWTQRVLNGLGQIMLQENILCGFLFLSGLFAAHYIYGLAALTAVLCGTLTAHLLKYDKKETDSGLYGFSPALVGVVLVFLFKPVLLTWILLLVGSSAAAVLQHYFIKRNIPAYTFPFILVSWILIFLIRNFIDLPAAEIQSNDFLKWPADYLLIGTKSYGQVIFQSSTLSGILFFLGVLISAPLAGIYALLAAFLCSFLALIFGQAADSVWMGIYGFNPVLTAIVFAGPKIKDAFWVLLAVILTLFIQIILIETAVLNSFGGVLTFPFVAGTWLTLIIKSRLKTAED